MFNTTSSKFINKKNTDVLTNAPTPTIAGSFIEGSAYKTTSAQGGTNNYYDGLFYVANATNVYRYYADFDSWQQLPAPTIAGTFGNGACGMFKTLGVPGGTSIITATAGTTTTITTSFIFYNNLNGVGLRVVSGTGMGYVGTISQNTIGSTTNGSVITLYTPNGVAFDNTTVFQIFSGSFWFFNPGVGAVGFAVYDIATQAWTNLSVANLPTTWGNNGTLCGMESVSTIFTYGQITGTNTTTTLVDTAQNWAQNCWAGQRVRILGGTAINAIGFIVSNTATTLTISNPWAITPGSGIYYVIETNEAVAAGVSTGSNTTTVINDTTQVWGTNCFANYQLRIVSGLGAGQIRAITSNTATAMTLSQALSVTPNNTSTYCIEPTDDFIYLMGNNDVPIYRFSIFANTWTLLTPAVARSGSQTFGGTGDFNPDIKDPTWLGYTGNKLFVNSTGTVYKQTCRNLYSFRGGSSSVLDIYDIAANTWVSGVNYAGAINIPASSGSCSQNGYVYIMQGNTGNVFRFDIVNNIMIPWLYLPYGAGTAAVEGDKIDIQLYWQTNYTFYTPFIFVLQQSGTIFQRCAELLQ